MPSTGKWYGNAFPKAFNKEIDLDSDTLKVMLVGSSYVFDQDAHVYKSSVTGEVVGTGYTAGGATLSSVAITYTAATNTLKFAAANVQWPASTIAATGAVIYDSTPATDATRPLLVFVDFGGTITATGGAFDLTWDANGIATVSVA